MTPETCSPSSTCQGGLQGFLVQELLRRAAHPRPCVWAGNADHRLHHHRASSSPSSPSPPRRVAKRERGLPAHHPRPSTVNDISRTKTAWASAGAAADADSRSPWDVAKVITVGHENRAHRGAWPRCSPWGASNVLIVGRGQGFHHWCSLVFIVGCGHFVLYYCLCITPPYVHTFTAVF